MRPLIFKTMLWMIDVGLLLRRGRTSWEWPGVSEQRKGIKREVGL